MPLSAVSPVTEAEYPIYGLGFTRAGLLVIAGGGGHGNYGVPNMIEVFAEVNGRPRRVCRFEDKKGAFSNLAVHPTENVLAAGIDGSLTLYNMLLEPADMGAFKGRRLSMTIPDPPCIYPTNTQLTDFHDEDQFQNVVTFSGDGSRLATGGADGNVRIWIYPSLKLQHTLKAHSSQIVDIHFDSSGSMLASVDNSRHCMIWKTVDGSLDREMSWFMDNSLDAVQYFFRCCRFINVQGTSYLITAVNPGRADAKLPSFLVVWDVKTWTESRRVPLSTDAASSLACSMDGSHVAVGSMEGFVTLVSTSDWKVIKRSKAHGLFVTGVAFSPDTSDKVLSASADRAVACVQPIHVSGSKDIILVFVGLIGLIALFVVMFLAGGSSEETVPSHSSL